MYKVLDRWNDLLSVIHYIRYFRVRLVLMKIPDILNRLTYE